MAQKRSIEYCGPLPFGKVSHAMGMVRRRQEIAIG